MSTVIMPTIGRVVWFYENKQQLENSQPYDAHVCYVHSNRLINVAGFNHGGTAFSRTSITLVQEGDLIPDTGSFCTWMPYQQAQAKKQDPAPDVVLEPKEPKQ